MDIQKLTSEIEQLESEPPFDKWHPEFCGDIDMIIKNDGRWWYMGSPIGREKLVKLFAKVLIFEQGEYFLKTPVELIRIQVEDAPFVITEWQKIETDLAPVIEVTSNLGHKAIMSCDHPLTADFSDPENPLLYVVLHRGLKAKVHRNVYYQWIEIAEEKCINNQEHLIIKSGKDEFSLGHL